MCRLSTQRLWARSAMGLARWLVLGAIWLTSLAPISAAADMTAPAAEWHVCAVGCPYSSVQAAVDAAQAGDVIKIAAGTYTDVFTRSNRTQAVYIDKSLALQGGFAGGDWNTFNPVANPTTLDARQHARVVYIGGNISVTLAGLHITGGQPHAWSGGADHFADGGGVYIVTATVTLQDNIIFSNTVGGPGFGGAILRNGGGVYLSNSAVTLINTQVVSNAATGDGAGLYLVNSAGTLSGNVIAANQAGGNGGGVCLVISPATVTGNTVAGNQAISDAGGSGSGGGIWMQDSAATLSGNSIVSNIASAGGGGMHVDTRLLFGSRNATIEGNRFISNTAGSGGGLDLQPGTSAPYNRPPPIVCSGNIVRGNTAQWNGGGLAVGGNSEGAAVNGNTISDNRAGYTGGGISASGILTLASNLVSSNQVTNTGSDGGGVALDMSSALLSGNVIAGNVARSDGGGLFLRRSPATAQRNWILANTAFDGSGMYLDLSDAMFVNTVIADNRVSFKGCTICYTVSVIESSPRFLHMTLARNTGLAAIYLTDWNDLYSQVALTNTLIISHAAGIKATPGNTATLNGVLWYSDTMAYSGGAISVTHAYTGDPLLGADGYHILTGSPAIDRGVDAGVPTDIDGHIRPSGPAADLGADEWEPPPYRRVFLPVALR